jgi:hypothetical protein
MGIDHETKCVGYVALVGENLGWEQPVEVNLTAFKGT